MSVEIDVTLPLSLSPLSQYSSTAPSFSSFRPLSLRPRRQSEYTVVSIRISLYMYYSNVGNIFIFIFPYAQYPTTQPNTTEIYNLQRSLLA